MQVQKSNRKFLRFPVISHGAEFLVQGFLMRRNILTYKAPPSNEGYDLICIHPDPRIKSEQVRIQVKSRYQTDCNKTAPIKEKALNAFDFLIVVFQNIGYFYRRSSISSPERNQPEFWTLPVDFVRKQFDSRYSWQRINLKDVNEKYKNENGFELIAKRLKIDYPSRGQEVICP